MPSSRLSPQRLFWRHRSSPPTVALRLACLAAFAAAFLVAGPTRAQLPSTAAAADEAPLRMLTPAQRTLLSPVLERGPVLMALFREHSDEMPAIIIAARVHASADQVAEVLSRPEGYPAFMPALDHIRVETRQGTQVAYHWQWNLSLFTLTGRNVMTVFPGNERRGHRINVRSTGGDMGLGRMRWRVVPEGPNQSMLILSQRVDMGDANYVSEQLSSGGTGVQRSINIILGTVMVLGTKEKAEQVAGYEAPARDAGELARPALDLEALAPLVGMSDMVFLETSGREMSRISVLGRAGTNRERLRSVMVDPEAFGRTLIDGSRAEVEERREDGIVFRWGIPLPLVGVEGRMLLRPSDGEIAVRGLSGSLRSGQWHFDTPALPWGEASALGWARFDPRETSGLVRSIIGSDHHFAHGLAMATQVMVMRSLRRQAIRSAP